MQWLLIPHSYKMGKQLRSESNFLVHRDFAEYLTRQGDYVYMVVPRWGIWDGGLDEIPGVEYVAADAGAEFWGSFGCLNPEILTLFSRLAGKFPIDAVFTSRFGVVPALRVGLQLQSGDNFPLIYWEPAARDKVESRGRDEPMMHLYTYALVHSLPIFLTRAELDTAIPYVERYAPPHLYDRFLDTAKVNPVGVRCDVLDEYITDKNETLTVFYGARINNVKRALEIFDVVKDAYKSGRHFQYWIVSQTRMQIIKSLLRQPYRMVTGDYGAVEAPDLDDGERIFVRPETGRDAYLRAAAKAHVALYWSKHEGFPVGFWEQMYLGVICIFPDEPWALSQLPEDYPFIFDADDRMSAYTMLTWVLDHYDEAKAQFDRVMNREFIRQNYDVNVVWGRIREWALEWHERNVVRQGRLLGRREEAQVFLPALDKMGDRFRFQDLIDQMALIGQSWHRKPRMRAGFHRAASNWKVYQRLIQLGGKVVGMEGKHPVIEKPKRGENEEEQQSD